MCDSHYNPYFLLIYICYHYRMLILPTDFLHISHEPRVNFSSFSSVLHVTVFSSLLGHVFYICNSCSTRNSSNILPTKFLRTTPCLQGTTLNPSICLPTIPLWSPKHIIQSDALCKTHSSFRPPQIISPSLHGQYPSNHVLFISHLACNTHQSPSFAVLQKRLLPFHSHYPYSSSQPAHRSAHQASSHISSNACALQDERLHLPCWDNSNKNKAKKAVSKTMREEVEKELTELGSCTNWMFEPVKVLRIRSKEAWCVSESHGMLRFGEKERGEVWKDYMIRIIDVENDCDHNV